MSQKGARAKRKAAKPAKQSPIGAARVRRDKALSKLSLEQRAKLDEVLAEWAQKKREVWKDYDDTRDAIVKGEATAA